MPDHPPHRPDSSSDLSDGAPPPPPEAAEPDRPTSDAPAPPINGDPEASGELGSDADSPPAGHGGNDGNGDGPPRNEGLSGDAGGARPPRWNPLLAFTTNRPVGVLVVVVAICVFGYVALGQLPLELLPNVSYPRLTIRTEFPTGNPEQVESQVSRAIEDGLGSVRQLVRKSSLSRAELSEVTLDFQWGTDLSQASTEVRQKLDRVNIPGAQAPLVLRYDPTLEPILRLALSEQADLPRSVLATNPVDQAIELRRIAADVLKPQLEQVDGVAAVNVLGGAEPQVRVLISETQMREHGVTIDTVANLLRVQNVEQAAGMVEEGQREFLVRTVNRFRTLDEIRALRVRDGVRLDAIARVEFAQKDPEILTRLDGRPSVEIEILKEADANIVTVGHRVWEKLYGDARVSGGAQWQVLRAERGRGAYLRDADNPNVEARRSPYESDDDATGFGRRRAAADLNPDVALAELLPRGVSVDVLTDQSFFIEDAIRELAVTAMIGGLLAVFILFAFLRRAFTTFVVALAIPVSIMATFVPMRLFDVSLNLMSFGGLALGLGMLVDNAIVVLESIARCREEGDDPRTAAVRGVSEVFSAIVAATLTTIVVFAPIVFVEGVAGQIFGDQALTIVFSLFCSLAVATFVIPVLAALHFSVPGEPTLRREMFVPRFARTWQRLAYRVATGAWLAPLWRWLGRPVPPLPAHLRDELSGEMHASASHADLPPRGAARRSWWRTLLLIVGSPVVVPAAVVLSVGLLAFQLVEAIVVSLLEAIWRYGFVAVSLLLLAAIWLAVKTVLVAGKYALLGPARLFDTGLQSLIAGYRAALRGALRHAGLVIGVIAVLAGAAVHTFGSLEQEMLPRLRQGEFTMQISLSEGRSLDQTQRALRAVEEVLWPYTRDMEGRPPLVERFTLVAGEGRDPGGERIRRENVARLTIVMTRGAAPRHEEELRAKLRAALEAHPDLRDPEFTVPTLFTLATPMEIEVRGGNSSADLVRIRDGAREVEEIVRALRDPADNERPLFGEVRTSVRRGNPEIRVRYDRQLLSQHNLTPQQVTDQLQQKIHGVVPTDYTFGDRRIDMRVVLDDEDRVDIQAVLGLRLAEGLTVGEACTFEYVEGPSEIRRRGNQRTAVLSANPAPGISLSEAEGVVAAALAEAGHRFPNVHVRFSGETAERAESFRSLILALLLAVFLVYVVLAVQFESLVQPFIILLTVPLAMVGVVFALAWLGLPISVVAIIGVIVLAGIVVNNAIVLIDRINYNRALGLPLDDAIVEGGAVRVRPILITTLTTVLGLLPLTGWLNPLLAASGLADVFGEGMEIRAPMAIAIVVGLSVSTLLTLLVIPVVYRILARLGNKTERQAADSAML